MKPGPPNSRSGLTRIELIIILAVLAVLALSQINVSNQAKSRAYRVACVHHLKNIGLCFRQWCLDNANTSPVQTNSDDVAAVFQTMSNYLKNPALLACPADNQRWPATNFATLQITNISYFFGLDANETMPNMLLAGDRNLTNSTAPPTRIMELTSNSVVGWTHGLHYPQGNVALADGSIQQMPTGRLRDALTNSGDPTNRLLMPY